MKNKFYNRVIAILFMISLLISPISSVSFANNSSEDNDNSVSKTDYEYIADDLEKGNLFRDDKEAIKVAESFLDKNKAELRTGSSKSYNLELVYPEEDEVSARSIEDNNAKLLYVFNKSNGGFIIVSGDKRATDILGYSEDSKFDYNNAPENLKGWISSYEDQIKYIQNNPDEFSTRIADKLEVKRIAEENTLKVNPFMNDIKWNQLEPYNLKAPEYTSGRRSATGCVATAMAQVMKYYNYPNQGVKDASYEWRNPYTGIVTKLSSDISNHVYAWKNMPKDYEGVTDEVQRMNVAQLMYDSGVSTKMEYGETSGTVSLYAGQAFVENFGYDKGLKNLYRSSYEKKEWQDIVKKELNDKRPVFYGGSGKEGGHQFVLDGFDENNLYHVNWGWGGMANGYYALDAMNPTVLGTGAAGGSYNMNQEILVGIKPSDDNIVEKTIKAENMGIMLDYPAQKEVANLNNEPYKANKNDVLLSKWSVFVESLEGFKGEFGLGVEIDGRVKIFNPSNNIEVGQYQQPQGIIWQNLGNVTDGIYELKMYQKADGETNYSEIPSKTGKSDIIKAQIEGNTVTYFLDELNTVNLEVTEFIREPDWELYVNSTAKFKLTLKNNGNEEYNSLVYVELEDKNTNEKYIIGKNQIVISPSEEKSINIIDDLKYNQTNIPIGKYTARIIYNKGNTQEEIPSGVYQDLGKGIDVEIKDKTTGVLEYIETPRFVYNTDPKVAGKPSDLNIVTKIKASGGLVEGKFTAIIADYGTANQILNFSSENFRLENNVEKEIIIENYDVSKLIDGNKYWIFMAYNGKQLENFNPLPFTYKKAPEVDKKALEEKIKEAEEIEKDKYTEESIKVLEEKLVEAKEVNTNPESSQEEVDKALEELTNAIKGLEEKPVTPEVDKKALEGKIKEAEEIEKDKYTEESIKVLEEKLAEAKEVNTNPESSQEEVDKAVEELTNAIKGLEEKPVTPEVDKKALEEKIKEAEEIEKDKYTEESIKVLEEKLAEAKEVNTNPESSQEEVDKAVEELTNAIKGLEEKPVTPEVDKKALEEKIKEAEEIEKDKYTEESIKVLEEKLVEAKEVNTNPESSQEEVDKAVEDLTNAIKGLEEKPVTPDKDSKAILMGGTAAISNNVQGKLTKYDTVRRVFGADRYGTAIAASKEMYKTGAKTVVIASGQQFSDELTATVYANIIHAPILLTEKGSIAQKTITEIQRLGAKNIIIIGGDAVISNGVQSRLSKLGNVRRIVGADRYSTAVKIAKEIEKEVGTISEVALVNGTNFPDAISMTSYAVDRKIPILLTEPANLNSNTEKLVNEWKVKDVKIGGGEVAVSKAAEKKLTAKGITVKRFMGADRYGTSVAVARALNLDAKNIVIASGENFADAVVGAPLAAHKEYPIVLVKQNAIPDSVNGYLNK
ncbi:C10 family peptidase [Miniphocaeibacter massiliensis]|uniref:C10 family peptidase n=1 Tax=Miniphocaeibacter massiliensis TaxID=2041841 RepID=UPI0013E9DE02|nr:C10 family peptidase [Miniphocaeibacter massiliensis]